MFSSFSFWQEIVTWFSQKYPNRKATRKWRGTIQSQDQAVQAGAACRSWWPRQLWIAAASCQGTPDPLHKDKGNSWWRLCSLETPLSCTECPPQLEGDWHSCPSTASPAGEPKPSVPWDLKLSEFTSHWVQLSVKQHSSPQWWWKSVIHNHQ